MTTAASRLPHVNVARHALTGPSWTRRVEFTRQRAVASGSVPVVSIRPAQGRAGREVPSPPGCGLSPRAPDPPCTEEFRS